MFCFVPDLPLRNPETISEAIRQDAAPTRFFLLLIALFAGFAVVLAMVGLYGVVSYLVSRRTREIGIRLALGASRLAITRLVLRHALGPALLGIAGGLLASIAVTEVMRSQLFEVEPTDPLVLGAVSVLLLVVAMAASMIPARRAMRVNPAEVLRIEYPRLAPTAARADTATKSAACDHEGRTTSLATDQAGDRFTAPRVLAGIRASCLDPKRSAPPGR